MLVALVAAGHEFHDRVVNWLLKENRAGTVKVATCSITELAFIRVFAQTPDYRLSIEDGQGLLARVKRSKHVQFHFFKDDQGAAQLPTWVKTSRQTTDGHLVELARSKGALLATLDRGIKGAFLIPASS